MGYKRNKLLHIKYEEGHELHGLELQIRPAKVKMLTQLSNLDTNSNDMSLLMCHECQIGKYEDCTGGIIEDFVSYVQSWNLEDDDNNPIPCTVESMVDQDIEFLLYLLESWADATGSIPVNLQRKSSSGEQSQEQSTLTDLLSESQTPLQKPN